MKLLLDTHLLLWAAGEPYRMSVDAWRLLEAPENDLVFSAASIWELMVKSKIGPGAFKFDARAFRRGLLDNGYVELPISTAHLVAIDNLPLLHKDPFDRLLVAQAQVEDIKLLTADPVVARYPGPVQWVG